MKAQPECIPCILRQVLNAARKVNDDAWLHRKVLNEIMQTLVRTDFDRSPAELVSDAMRIAQRPLGNADPFAADKRANVAAARALEARLRAAIDKAPDPLHAALRASAGANVLDAQIFGPVDIWAGIDRALAAPLAIDDYAEFKNDFARAKTVLFLGDSAAETIADKLLVERLRSLGAELTYVVRRAPILNDATREDAEAAGLAPLATIMDTGADGMGAALSLSSQEFRTRFDEADIVLAKGAANFETLDGEPKTKYFLVSVKCPVVARHLGVAVGDAVFLKS